MAGLAAHLLVTVGCARPGQGQKNLTPCIQATVRVRTFSRALKDRCANCLTRSEECCLRCMGLIQGAGHRTQVPRGLRGKSTVRGPPGRLSLRESYVAVQRVAPWYCTSPATRLARPGVRSKSCKSLGRAAVAWAMRWSAEVSARKPSQGS